MSVILCLQYCVWYIEPGLLRPVKGRTAYFAGIDKARFRRKVVPGDVLLLETEIIKVKGPIGVGRAVARVDGYVRGYTLTSVQKNHRTMAYIQIRVHPTEKVSSAWAATWPSTLATARPTPIGPFTLMIGTGCAGCGEKVRQRERAFFSGTFSGQSGDARGADRGGAGPGGRGGDAVQAGI